MNPKVFLSHASEDKERFVLQFAEKLRGKGIEVWLDKWEMLPGDSLVEKIFDEGLKHAQAIIIVLSSISTNKPWVKEELNVAVIKKINEQVKLIPVIIDNCQVPEFLKSVLWVRITNLEDYDEELNQIVYAIYGTTVKPPLGPTPEIVQLNIPVLPNFTKLDTLILKTSCDIAVSKERPAITTKEILEIIDPNGAIKSEIYESLDILDRRGLIKAEGGMDGISIFFITTYGFDQYARLFIPDLDLIYEEVISQIVNFKNTQNKSISTEINRPLMIVNNILEVLESNRHIQIHCYMGGNIKIYNVSPELKRILQQ
jgi:hypothetical protein